MTSSYQQPYKQLRRARDERQVAGVCAGVARYFGVDPVAVRVATVVLAVITGGLALLAYIVVWIVMPEEPLAPQPWPGPAGGPAPGNPPSDTPPTA